MGDIQQNLAHADGETFSLRVAARLRDVAAADWDACAQGNPALAPAAFDPCNPFISHAFLMALEDSFSATRATGWLPHHLLLEARKGSISGCGREMVGEEW